MSNLYIVTITNPAPEARARLRQLLIGFGREVLPGLFECYLTSAQRARLKKRYAASLRIVAARQQRVYA